MNELDEVEKMIIGIKSLATPLQDLILREAMDDREYANKAAAELSALRERVEATKPFVDAFEKSCNFVPKDEDEKEQILYDIFNLLSLEDFAKLAAALQAP